jgi:hypothetical protein
MQIFGLPVWSLVIVACILAPYAINAWADAERKRARARTEALLSSLDAESSSGAASAWSEASNDRAIDERPR